MRIFRLALVDAPPRLVPVPVEDRLVPAAPQRRRPRPSIPAGTLVVAACLAIAGASVVTLPTVPLYDAFSWLVWGRELAHHVIGPHEPFVIAGGASWKPLPVLVTTVLGFTGSSAVTLWMVFVRTVGLLGLWFAYRLGAGLGASERWRGAAPVGGMLAAVSVLLTQQWFGFMISASSEPLTITATLLAVERVLAGRRLQGLTAGVALALMRPEAGVLVGLYGLWCLWHEPGIRRRLLVVAELALVPAAWLAPPWLADGSPLQAATRARQFQGNLGHHLATLALTRAAGVVPTPVTVAALALVLLALWRRERTVLWLAAVSLSYLAVIEVETLHGLPGLSRFMLPAAAVVFVLAGAGVARVASIVEGGLASTVLAATLFTLGVLCCPSPISPLTSARQAAELAQRGHEGLVVAVDRAGGAGGVLPCPSSSAVVNWREAPQLAWILGVPLTRIQQSTRSPTSVAVPELAFFALRETGLGTNPPRPATGLREHLIMRAGLWRVSQILPSGNARPGPCVGR